MNGKLRLDEFLSWWTQQMLDLIPARLRRTGMVLPDALVVSLPSTAPGDADPHEAAFSLRRRGRESSIGHFALDGTGLRALSRMLRGRRKPTCIVLRPPPAALLERSVSLPLAAARDPGAVLRYELDRLTPFTAEEVFWAWRLEFRDTSRRLLQLRLSLLPKAGLLAPIEALRRAGLAPVRLEPLAPDGRPSAMGLGEPDGAALPRREAWRRRGLAVLWALCGGLAAAAIALPFVIQSLGLAAAERHMAALRPRVAEAEGLRKRIAEAKGSHDVVAAERARVGDALQVIAALTELLPDDTYLTDLTLRQRKLTMGGRSAAAARLIGLLSADPTIRDAAFIAPITRATSGPGDMFSIRAELGM
ncbi:MAG TPA: PilN domain-containing protein [Crenalkalicoccus sp.]|nr:PilN domain-containing protein [Crenalkalicoccus sp.]